MYDLKAIGRTVLQNTAGGGTGRLRCTGAAFLVAGYLAALAAFLVLQALGDSGLSPISYFFTWDMFPSYSTESVRRVAVGQTRSGKFVRLLPSPLQQVRGGVHGDLTRVDLERRRFFYRSTVEQTLKTTSANQQHDPVRHVFLFEEFRPVKFNYSDDLYKSWSGTQRPHRTYWRLTEEFDVAAAYAGEGP